MARSFKEHQASARISQGLTALTSPSVSCGLLYRATLLFSGSSVGVFTTMLGGIVYVAQALFQSDLTLTLRMTTNKPFITTANGQAASTYITSDTSTYGNCKRMRGSHNGYELAAATNQPENNSIPYRPVSFRPMDMQKRA